jgi:hypothetical protein
VTRDQSRAQVIPLDARRAKLIQRFGLRAVDLSDQRIGRLLNFKIRLDEEIADLLGSGAREASVRRFAALARIADDEISRDWRLAALIKSILEARQCIATLRPPIKKAVSNANSTV